MEYIQLYEKTSYTVLIFLCRGQVLGCRWIQGLWWGGNQGTGLGVRRMKSLTFDLWCTFSCLTLWMWQSQNVDPGYLNLRYNAFVIFVASQLLVFRLIVQIHLQDLLSLCCFISKRSPIVSVTCTRTGIFHFRYVFCSHCTVTRGHVYHQQLFAFCLWIILRALRKISKSFAFPDSAPLDRGLSACENSNQWQISWCRNCGCWQPV